MARTLVEVVVMVEVGTCGHRQGVMSTWPISLAGGLHGGESNGRGVQTGWALPLRKTLECQPQGRLSSVARDSWELGDGAELGPGKCSREVVLTGFPVARNDSDVKTLDICYSLNPPEPLWVRKRGTERYYVPPP